MAGSQRTEDRGLTGSGPCSAPAGGHYWMHLGGPFPIYLKQASLDACLELSLLLWERHSRPCAGRIPLSE